MTIAPGNAAWTEYKTSAICKQFLSQIMTRKQTERTVLTLWKSVSVCQKKKKVYILGTNPVEMRTAVIRARRRHFQK